MFEFQIGFERSLGDIAKLTLMTEANPPRSIVPFQG